jgi:hypothetical protein
VEFLADFGLLMLIAGVMMLGIVFAFVVFVFIRSVLEVYYPSPMAERRPRSWYHG